MKKIFSLVALLLMTTTLFAQHEQGKKRVSPPDTARGKYITVAYSQPSKKGRVIFGGLVPYGKVWRTGANEATEITFKKDAMFGGKHVKKGTYTLFTIPEKDSWTIILNGQLKQWGAFSYDKYKDKDVLHIKVPVSSMSAPLETFKIKVTDDAVVMMWDMTKVSIPVKI